MARRYYSARYDNDRYYSSDRDYSSKHDSDRNGQNMHDRMYRDANYWMRHGDTGMIKEDVNARSRLPVEVKQTNWPSSDNKNGRYISADLYTGVQKKLAADSKEFNGAFKEGKY